MLSLISVIFSCLAVRMLVSTLLKRKIYNSIYRIMVSFLKPSLVLSIFGLIAI